MARLTDIRVPLPQRCEGQAECHRHLTEISDRLTANLRDRLADEFEILRDVRPVAFGGQWSRDTRVYRDDELRATFSVAYDYVISPHDFQVSCSIPARARTRSKAPALAASLLLAAGATSLGGPLVGVLAGGSLLLAGTLAGHAGPFGPVRAPLATDLFPAGLRLDPLLS